MSIISIVSFFILIYKFNLELHLFALVRLWWEHLTTTYYTILLILKTLILNYSSVTEGAFEDE